MGFTSNHIRFPSLALLLTLTVLSPTIASPNDPPASPSASPSIKPFDCGTNTEHAPKDFLDAISNLHSSKLRRDASAGGAAHAGYTARSAQGTETSSFVVDTVFHIIATDSTKADITDDMPSAQLDVLNESYSPYGISFNLLNVTWNKNPAWATGTGNADKEMKKALRQGTYATLNIYFQTELAGGVLGRCTLPSSVGPADDPVPAELYFTDGCNVNANTMPAGLLDGYNAGKTAVHETGHWLGLLHTCEGNSCEGPGDYIEDTAPERESSEGCPKGKSTCGEVDPIHNYMDYSEDACYEGFSEGQRGRMHKLWREFREGR
jgi:hypothetical protein